MRDGKDYYIVHSSFDYYPGLLIWHSTDLINWSPVTTALSTYVGAVWAPDLVKVGGTYYIYFPANNTNYVVAAENIAGPWTEPVDLKIGNIDPGHVMDDKGNRYFYFSNGDYVPLANDGLSITGKAVHSYDGWKIPREWSIECFCMEGPKLFKRGDFYYLTVAEGGTAGPATSHMIISARSRSPLGPWENTPTNPVIHTASSSEKWWSQGHGTPFEDANGQWWMLFHAYENGFYNMGRQTLLLPLKWTEDGWYYIPDGITAEGSVKKPVAAISKPVFSLNDDFKQSTLKPQWKFFGGYDSKRFRATSDGLSISGKGKGVGDSSPLAIVPPDHSYTAEVEMDISGDAIGGLVLFYNNNYFSGILCDGDNILANLRGWQFLTEKNVVGRHLFLRLKNTNNTVDMFYSTNGNDWIKVENSLDVSGYNHNALSGFLGIRIGLCSVGNGEVKFKNFKYTPQ